ncbi:MAG: DNRLRE domain-containing protein [Bacteroidetes bacterium]|nr:DNRLRE domain-containing protein [Bacteroidota bacterium]
MKKVFSLFCIVLLIGFQIKAQTTITLQPDESSSKDALIWNITPTTPNPLAPDFIATAWTNSGNLSIIRSLIDFDFSSIPANATILNASLSLYHYTSTANVGHSTQSGSNMCLLRRITSTWNENTVCWNNQPTTTTQNQVIIPQSTNDTMDYPNINITNLIKDIINNPSSSYGLMMLLDNENYFRSMLFSSSNNTNNAKRPKLVITYTTSTAIDTCITINTNNSSWKDAAVWNITPTVGNSVAPDFIATAWTNSGNLSIIRSLLKFDIAIPNNAIITSAKLSLYHYNSAANVGHSTQSGSNAAVLLKLTSAWNESTVNWTNQPGTTTQNQVFLPTSLSDTMDYTNIDITNMAIDFYNNPSSNYGFLFKLLDENYYRSLLFGSKDCPNSAKLPKVEICYHINTAVNNIQQNDINISVTPNPFSDKLNLNYVITESNNVSIEIFDLLGKRILNEDLGKQTIGSYNHQLTLDNQFEKGIYLLKFNAGKHTKNLKIIKN